MIGPHAESKTDPLSRIALLNKPVDRGEIIWAATLRDPADSPNIVTKFGSPPK